MLLVTLSHFMVDLSCAFLVASIKDTNIIVALLLYNFCAFALQMPLGLIVEGRFPPLKIASVGIALIIVSWLFIDYKIVALTIAGFGNALFHLGGGLSVMSKTSKAASLGTFIAPGALGIYLGAFLKNIWQIPIILIMCTLVLLHWVKKDNKATSCDTQFIINHKYWIIISLLIVVIFRGFIGTLQTFPWKSEWSLAFVLAVVLGKIIGGFLSDKFGALKTGMVSLITSAICFLVPSSPILGLIGVLAFQTTMPITLWVVTRVTAKGFGFGLLTFGLFIGSIPTFLNLQLQISLTAMTIISLIIFTLGIKLFYNAKGKLL